MKRPPLLLSILILFASGVIAKGSDVDRVRFLASAFGNDSPILARVWLSGEVADHYKQLFGSPPNRLRLSYWHRGPRSAWILEAIGKERPITAGFIVESGEIVSAQVLAFRESRGWEIKLPAFTAQFDQLGLNGEGRLARNIDGISGATLSVRAMERMARLALYLHNRTVASR